MLRRIQRVGKRASKFQYTATYQSVVVECMPKDKWRPTSICVSWTRRGRRLITKLRPWQPSPDNKARGVVIWPEPEVMEITVTLYKGPKDQSYESKEWDFAVIDVDSMGKRKVLATAPINMVRYVSSLPFDHDLHLRLKPVSRKIKAVILDVSITSEFLKEGKATDDDMMSIASMMSVSNLSTIGFLEDDEEDDYNYMVGVRSISPPDVPENILSTDELLKWAQEITRELPDVKITNMTTSWRNGLGFLAVIHHFRPDLLPDFDMQSPNAIKENNRTAFSIARSLGIACPLTPNMMVTTTVPDKLSVTSFVYQMYQFFTKARMSAIAKAEKEGEGNGPGKGSRGTSPSSPFDMSKFDMFTKDLSPTTSPTGRNDRVMLYSKHSNDELRRGRESPPTEEAGQSELRGEGYTYHPRVDSNLLVARLSPTLVTGKGSDSLDGVGGGFDDGKRLRLDQLVSEHAQMVPSGKGSSDWQGPPKTSHELDREVEFENTNTESEESSQAEGSSTSLLEDKSILELPSDIKPGESATASSNESSFVTPYKYTPGKMDSLKEGTSTSAAATSTSTTTTTTTSTTTGVSGRGRKLPNVPVATSSPKLSDKVKDGQDENFKKEERKRLAQEMLKKHKLDKFKLPQSMSLDAGSDSSNTSKYRREAISMLSEALGTPITSKKDVNKPDPSQSDKNSDVSDDFISCGEGSAASLGVDDESERVSTCTQQSMQEKRKMSREAKSDSSIIAAGKEKIGRKLPLLLNTGGERGKVERTVRASSEERTGAAVQNGRLPKSGTDNEDLTTLKLVGDKDFSTAGGNNVPLRASTDPAVKGSEDGGSKDMDANVVLDDAELPPALPPRSNTTGSSDIKNSEQTKELRSPVEKRKKVVPARPISARPSQVLKRMLDEEEREREKLKEEKEKQRQQALKEAEEKRLQALRDAEEKEKEEKEKEEREKKERQMKEEEEKRKFEEKDKETGQDQVEEEDTISPVKESWPIPATTPSKKSLPSPSAWSQHSDDINMDLLVSQSDYVKTELKSLQRDVQDLESRAQDIESNIRESMSNGEKDEEEDLMQEWFGLLNRKNEMIKRQIHLNMIEKEEDLEKRQFFLNRELRPLMEIPEEEKTTEQKERADHLLKELLELIDERDRLEKRKMDHSKIRDYEREGLAHAQARSADLVHSSSQQTTTGRQANKDCVIS